VRACRERNGKLFPKFKQAAPERVTAQGGIVGWTAPVAGILEAIN
jgi:hypothetical protein